MNGTRSPWLAKMLLSLAIVIMLLTLVSCSDESSSDAVIFPDERHTDERAIAATAEFDSQNNAQPWGTRAFQKETQLLLREQHTPTAPSDELSEIPGERKAYFGDLHVHTAYSFDGYVVGTLASPYDAYRYARGEVISHPAGFGMQLSRPMDFYAVTDHAMFLGVLSAAADTATEFSKNDFSQPYHDLNSPENMGTGLFSLIRRGRAVISFVPAAIRHATSGESNLNHTIDVIRTAWGDIINAADQFYDPGNFTTFAAFEYSSSTDDMGNLHRNVVFEGTEQLPREPFSRFHSPNPEDLWQWMDELREKGVESLAIPHNPNGSNGQMFKLADWAGDPLDDDYAKQRMRNEPIIEITQIKGTSETHPTLSTRDEWADFEIMPYRVGTNALSKFKGSYVRDALLEGIALDQEGMTNPYQFGFIGSSDTHTGASEINEANYKSKLGLLSSTAEARGSVPRTGLTSELGYQAMKLMGRGTAQIKISGSIYADGSNPTWGASGLAGAWAEENTRTSLYSAFRRKEVFATSGPRIQIRLFGGFDFDESMLTDVDGIDRAYAQGVPMGGTLSLDTSNNGQPTSDSSLPAFIVMASADPESAPLQRLQIVKGWVDAGGTHEEVIDVACAGGASVNSVTKRCPDNDAIVDITDCSINAESGASQLSVLWHDPEFRPDQAAFYYARVIENPTCRWSTWDAARAGVAPRPDLPTTIQERAWSSPIHYSPNKPAQTNEPLREAQMKAM